MNKYIQDTYKNIGGSNAKIEIAGKQTFNGNQAVTYARIRKDAVDWRLQAKRAYEDRGQGSVREGGQDHGYQGTEEDLQ